MGSVCFDPSIVHHVCFDFFQHTTKIDGELTYAFDFFKSIDNHGKRCYDRIGKDDSLKTNRSEKDDVVMADEQLIPSSFVGIDNCGK